VAGQTARHPGVTLVIAVLAGIGAVLLLGRGRNQVLDPKRYGTTAKRDRPSR
jgi:hypothetical protein